VTFQSFGASDRKTQVLRTSAGGNLTTVQLRLLGSSVLYGCTLLPQQGLTIPVHVLDCGQHVRGVARYARSARRVSDDSAGSN
jgi:hypothetical protein